MSLDISETRHATVEVLEEIQHFETSPLSQNDVSDVTLDARRTKRMLHSNRE